MPYARLHCRCPSRTSVATCPGKGNIKLLLNHRFITHRHTDVGARRALLFVAFRGRPVLSLRFTEASDELMDVPYDEHS
jgi:hypothetical protein